MVHKKIGPTIDLFAPVIGVSFNVHHPLNFFLIFQLCGTLLSWILQCYISADQFELVYSDDKVGLVDYLLSGYRIGVSSPKGILKLLQAQPERTQRQIRSILHAANLKNISELLYNIDDTGNLEFVNDFRTAGIFTQTELMAKRQIIVVIGDDPVDAGRVTQTTSVFVDEKYTCRMLMLNDYIDLKMALRFRLWGYMSGRVNWYLQYLFQSGIFKHLFGLYRNPATLGRAGNNQSKFERADHLIQSRPFSMKSTVGITAHIQLGLMVAMFLIHGIQVAWHTRNKFRQIYGQMRAKLKVYFRCKKCVRRNY